MNNFFVNGSVRPALYIKPTGVIEVCSLYYLGLEKSASGKHRE